MRLAGGQSKRAGVQSVNHQVTHLPQITPPVTQFGREEIRDEGFESLTGAALRPDKTCQNVNRRYHAEKGEVAAGLVQQSWNYAQVIGAKVRFEFDKFLVLR